MVVGSGTKFWSRRNKSNTIKWSDPQDSTGVFYRKMGRDSSCWEAVGKARETFIQIAEEIKLYLDKYSEPVSHPVTWTMYMIGRARETSQPMIMFCSRDWSSRQQVRKTVEESGILEKYSGIKVGDATRPPDFDQLVQLAGPSVELALDSLSDSLKESLYTNTLVFAKHPDCRFGKQIAIPFHNREGVRTSVRLATAGGILKSGEKYIYMTAGHVFQATVDSLLVEEGSDAFEFDIGEVSGSEDSLDFMETTSRGSVSPEPTDYNGSEPSVLSNSELETKTTSRDGWIDEEGTELFQDPPDRKSVPSPAQMSLDGMTRVVGSLLNPLKDQKNPVLDYALISIAQSPQALFEQTRENESISHFYPYSGIRTRLQDSDILCNAGFSGLLRGKMSGTPSYISMPGSTITQELWTVRFDGRLAIGDCGSWVVDDKTKELLGHIIAGSPDSGVAYVLPTYQVIEDAKIRFGLDMELSLPLLKPKTTTETLGVNAVSTISIDFLDPPQLSAHARELFFPPPNPQAIISVPEASLSSRYLAHTPPSSIDGNASPHTSVKPQPSERHGEIMRDYIAENKKININSVTDSASNLLRDTVDQRGSIVDAKASGISRDDQPNIGSKSLNSGTSAPSKVTSGEGYYMMYLDNLCRRRGWLNPQYTTSRESLGYMCLVNVDGREYRTDIAYESGQLAEENAAMRAFMVCRNFNLQGSLAPSATRHRRRGANHRNGYKSSEASASSESSW